MRHPFPASAAVAARSTSLRIAILGPFTGPSLSAQFEFTGGAPLPAASCVKLTLVFSDFTSSVLRYETP